MGRTMFPWLTITILYDSETNNAVVDHKLRILTIQINV